MTPSNAQKALDALNKIDFHPRSVDDGHYDAGYDYEDAGKFISEHIDYFRTLLQRELSGGWNTNMEEAPRDGSTVWVWWKNESWKGYWTSEKFSTGENVWMVYVGENTVKAANPTAWQPLPPPPKDEKKI
jgi:hypothetical protein